MGFQEASSFQGMKLPTGEGIYRKTELIEDLEGSIWLLTGISTYD